MKQNMNQSMILDIVGSCQYDMCLLENNVTAQNIFRCTSYANLVSKCYASLNGSSYDFTGWRTTTNCRNFDLKNTIFKNNNDILYKNFI